MTHVKCLMLGEALAVVLTSCAHDGRPATPSLPANAPTALVIGTANSPVHDALKSKVEMTAGDSSQVVTDFDLLIVDGDNFNAQEFREEEFVHNAVRGGVWVLGLDLEENEKQRGIGYLLGAGTPDRSVAYLVRQTRSPNGHLLNDHIDFQADPADAESTAEAVLGYVMEELELQQGSDRGPPDPPKGALYTEHNFSQAHTITLPQTKNPDYPGRPTQSAMWTQSGTIRINLENDEFPDYPLDGRQWVTVEQRGSVKVGTLAHSYNDCESTCPGTSDPRPSYEIAWPLTQIATETQFQIFGVPVLNMQSSSPSSESGQSSVITSSSFAIGMRVPSGPSGPESGRIATYAYQTSRHRDLMAWKVENISAPDAATPKASWRFASATPWDGFNTATGTDQQMGAGPLADASPFITIGTAYPTVADPNRHAQEGLEYATSSVWQAVGLLDENSRFVGGTDHLVFTDAWVRGSSAEPKASFASVARYDFSQEWGLNIDLDMVIPQAIESVSISSRNATGENTVTAGEPATGTVTLEDPAYSDARVYLSSLSDDLSLSASHVDIPKGTTTGTFDLQASGADVCELFTADLEAFYATGKRQEITILPPSPPDPSCN